jgi:xanthine dehydrogenase small subunit
MQETRDYILLYVNGNRLKIYGDDIFQPLADFLRYGLQITGTKVVCSEGDCGSCTVVQGKPENAKIMYQIVNSCIKYMYQLDCSHIITIEGLHKNGSLNPVQEAMVKNQGTQCGFCTPGFVVAMTAMFENRESLNQHDLKEGLTGNLCRCTGYEPIIKAGMAVDSAGISKFDSLYPPAEIAGDLQKYSQVPVLVKTTEKTFFNPVTVEEAVKFRKENETAVIVSGGTDISVQLNKKMRDPQIILSVGSIDQLNELKIENETLVAGAKISLSQIEAFIENRVPEFYNILKVFGSPQIKNAGTLAGNIANASPIADTIPFLFVMNAEIELTGVNSVRKVNINNFYKGYKVLDMKPDEIITRVFVPLDKPDETLKLYKVSKRKDLDISTFTTAILMKEQAGKIENINIAFGGVAATVLRLPETETFLKGKYFTEANFREAGKIARNEISPISDVRGSKDFRWLLAENIFMKFYFECLEEDKVLCQP